MAQQACLYQVDSARGCFSRLGEAARSSNATDYAHAGPLAARAGERLKARLGSEDSRYASVAQVLANVTFGEGDFAQAASLYATAAAVRAGQKDRTPYECS